VQQQRRKNRKICTSLRQIKDTVKFWQWY